MVEVGRNFGETPRGNHWIGTTSSQFSQFRNSEDISRRYQQSKSHLRQSKESENNGRNSDTAFRFQDQERRSKVPVTFSLEEQPLISTEILDAPKQRVIALIIFCIIQLYKLYDLMLLKSGLPVTGIFSNYSKGNFLIKYFSIDAFFLYVLSNFRIPMLSFGSYTVVMQILALSGLTYFTTTEHEFVFITSLISLWHKYNTKELSVTGGSINQRGLYDSSQHFKGALTIKILPENTAMLNPNGNPFCLSTYDSVQALEQITVPLRINSTSNIKIIELEYRDFDTNEIETKTLSKKHWDYLTNPSAQYLNKKLGLSVEKYNEEAKQSIKYLTLPLKQVGFYQIKKIVDSNGLVLKVYNHQLVVPNCPNAKITGFGLSDRCVGDTDNVNIELTGIPPLKLTYTKTVNGRNHTYFDSNLQPENFYSPLKSKVKTNFLDEDLEDLSWARDHLIDVNLSAVISKSGPHKYDLEKVIDGLGNVIDLSTKNTLKDENPNYNYGFVVHGTPKASLKEKINPKSPTKRNIIITVDDESKQVVGRSGLQNHTAYLSHYSSNGELDNFNISMSLSTHEFQAKLPGTYTLDRIVSNFCPGVIIGESSVEVTQPVSPQLQIKSTPILDDCIGQVGLSFDLTFSGVPPFHYVAKIYKMDKKKRSLFETKKFKSPSTRYQFSYNPSIEGNYEIVFDQLTNDLFNDPIKLKPESNYTFKTSMRVKPGAEMINGSAKSLCLNDSTEIPLILKGEPPFSLKYDIIEISSNIRKSYDINNITELKHSIKTPQFSVGGEYILSLVSIKDASGCRVSLTELDARLKVRKDTPLASVDLSGNLKHFKIKEGEVAELPIKLSGEAPFEVKIAHLDEEGNLIDSSEATFSSNERPTVRVKKEGYYKLLKMSDSSCEGRVIDQDKSFQVSHLDKPTFKIVENKSTIKQNSKLFMKTAICQGFRDSIDLVLTGSPPFTLNYKVTGPNLSSKLEQIQVATKYASINLPHDFSGDYDIEILELFDNNYNVQDVKNKSSHSSKVHIKQTVNSIPSVSFTNFVHNIRTCITSIDQKAQLEPLKLKSFGGEEPYTIKFNIYHESSGRTEKKILEDVFIDSFPYEKLYQGLSLGSHDVTIESVIDQNGCVNVIAEPDASHVVISITDAPKIHLIDQASSYCVGDYISYQLTGSAPFSIKYQFNDMQLKAKERSSQFVRLASEAGKIWINSISDSTSQCMVNFTVKERKEEYDNLSLTIHPLPAVTVSQGEYQVEGIHEGDQAEVIFSFEGTPPFSLTYVRTEKDAKSRGGKLQVVETHKVNDIFEYEYRLKTSLQGTYEAIEIADAYCSAQNKAFFTA